MRFNHLATIAVLPVLICLSACTTTQASQPQAKLNSVIDDISQAQSLWQAGNDNNYSFTVSLLCFCLPETRAPRIVTVSNNQVTSITLKTTGKSDSKPPKMLRKTVTEWFIFLQKQNVKRPDSASGTFAGDNGFPNRVSVDPHPRMADDEFSVIFSDFRPQN